MKISPWEGEWTAPRDETAPVGGGLSPAMKLRLVGGTAPGDEDAPVVGGAEPWDEGGGRAPE